MQPKTLKTYFPSKPDFNSRFKQKGQKILEKYTVYEVQMHIINKIQI